MLERTRVARRPSCATAGRTPFSVQNVILGQLDDAERGDVRARQVTLISRRRRSASTTPRLPRRVSREAQGGRRAGGAGGGLSDEPRLEQCREPAADPEGERAPAAAHASQGQGGQLTSTARRMWRVR
jgi:hypothetical protein